MAAKSSLVTLLLALATASAVRAAPPAQSPGQPPADLAAPAPDAHVYADPAQPLEARAQAILRQLTLEEKISLLHGDGTFTTAALPRFGIPQRWMSDGPQGVREEIMPTSWQNAGHTDDFATAMPAGIALAATFDESMATAMGTVIGEEAIARGKRIMLGPGVNIFRTPLNGRNAEYYGEDPWLASRMAVASIKALQGAGGGGRVVACVKHFALNNQEFQRNSIDVEVDDRPLHEIYLPAFKAAVTEAHAWAVMAAYNRFRGDYCSENDLLLNQILKQEWGFQGLVMSDWGGVHSTVKAATSGLDLEMGSSGPYDQWFFAAPLLKAVQANQVPLETIDAMALRNLRVMIASGMLEARGGPAVPPLMAPAHIEAERAIAEAGIVLLKNDRALLPLQGIHSIAVIGDIANTKMAHDGNSAAIKTAYEITPLEGIQKRAGQAITVTYARGYLPPGPNGGRARGRGAATAPQPASSAAATQADEAVAAAKNADVAIVLAGLYRRFDQEGADRRDIKLPAGQSELIQRVLAANPHTIVILTGGGPCEMDPWLASTPAVLQYWYGGTEGGNALARILFGDVNPSGHLPCTFPRQLADSSAHTFGPESYPGQNGRQHYEEGLLVGYRWFDAKKTEPLFPFGFGLSYTSFSLSGGGLRERAHLRQVDCTLANTGRRAGAQVVQCYVEPVHAGVPRPVRELKGFHKITLPPGESRQVQFDLPDEAFAYYDPATKAWIAEAGDYVIRIGASSRDLPLQIPCHLAQTITIPDAVAH
jgi:beta-glucosidase